MKFSRNQEQGQAGFTLIELLISIIILVIVMGAVFSQIDQVQKKTKVESLKLDLTQETRDFMDQFVRDMHMCGYPKAKIYQNAPAWNSSDAGSSGDPGVTGYALGLVKATPTELRFEGDIVGDGTVYSVSYKYFASDSNDPNCPCLRRSVDKKTTTNDPVNGYNPVYYTEIQNVIDPTGMTQGMFTYWEATGVQVNVGTGIDIVNNQSTIQEIDAIKVNLNTRSLQFDPHTGARTIVNTMATIAQLDN